MTTTGNSDVLTLDHILKMKDLGSAAASAAVRDASWRTLRFTRRQPPQARRVCPCTSDASA
jgi:hypothetical protein